MVLLDEIEIPGIGHNEAVALELLQLTFIHFNFFPGLLPLDTLYWVHSDIIKITNRAIDLPQINYLRSQLIIRLSLSLDESSSPHSGSDAHRYNSQLSLSPM